MDALRGSMKGQGKNRYYQRLQDAEDQLDHLPAAGKPPSGRRRKPPPATRRPKAVKVAPPPRPPPPAQAPPRPPAVQPVAPAPAATRAAQLGRRRRFFRVRLAPRLAFLRRAAAAPARLLRRLGRGYVGMMLRFAGAMGGAAPPLAGHSLRGPAPKEYDDKVLVQIYRALVAQGHILVVPAAGAAGADGVAVARLVAR